MISCTQASQSIEAGVGVTPTFAGYKSRHLREELMPMMSSAHMHSRRLQDTPTGCQVLCKVYTMLQTARNEALTLSVLLALYRNMHLAQEGWHINFCPR